MFHGVNEMEGRGGGLNSRLRHTLPVKSLAHSVPLHTVLMLNFGALFAKCCRLTDQR